MPIKEIIDNAPIYITGLIVILFLTKLYLQLKLEKGWDPTRFFHYTKHDLKMTTSKQLRAWRKRQNLFTKIALVLMLLLAFFLFFNSIRN